MNKKTIALIGCGAAVIGSFSPWASVKSIFGEITVSGMDGSDGKLTLFLAIAAGLLIYFGKKNMYIFAALLSIAGALTAFSDMNDLQKHNNEEGFLVTIGYGLWLCMLGFAIAAVVSVMIRVRVSSHKEVFAPPTPVA